MKTTFSGNALRKLATVLAGGAALMLMSSFAAASIANTKHNLSSTAAGGNKFAADNGSSEICVFCHTPHGAATGAAVPLWNRTLGTPSSYKSYASLGISSLDGATAPVGSVSIACLSCHDGIQAMNTVINQAGSGGYNPGGGTQPGGWTGLAAGASPIGSLNYAIPSIVNLGTDLSNDHPIGIQYAGGGYLASENTGASGVAAGSPKDADFVVPKALGTTTSAIFWVETGNNSTRNNTDLQLYTRTDTTDYKGTAITGGAQPYVECASCHDPHSSNTTFLRVNNTGSKVCLACHAK